MKYVTETKHVPLGFGEIAGGALDGQAVTLMTVHSSKGLEFDCVWVAGMEETLFPHMNSVGDAAAVEEERRLAYVAITRARKRLCLTCAQQRQICLLYTSDAADD